MTYKKQIRVGTILHDRNSYMEEIMTDTDYINDNTDSYMSLEEYNKLQNNYFTKVKPNKTKSFSLFYAIYGWITPPFFYRRSPKGA